MMRTRILAGLLFLVAPALSRADADLAQEKKNDVLVRALVDELERGKVGLKLEGLERPYFIEYALQDRSTGSVSAVLGSVTNRSENRSRGLRVDVRVGSYELDNRNFSGGGGRSRFGRGFAARMGGSIPIDDDYNAIRQSIWWATDRDYKSVIETLEQKKAFMESKVIEDKPDDHARAPAVLHFDGRTDVNIPLDRLEKTVVGLSAIFRECPEILRSSVSLSGTGGNDYLVNTEGTRLRTSNSSYSLAITATVQADDGMKLTDSISIQTRSLDDLPSLAEMEKRCREMVAKLVAVKEAPILESYTGPVLVDAPAAAALFSGQFASRFAGGQRALGGRTPPEDFENKLGKRILPRFLNVVDDPTRSSIAGTPVMGHYRYDQEGVEVRPVVLVENGYLKTLVMSRNPSKKLTESTGHGRGMFQPSASTGCLIVTSKKGASDEALKEKLIELFEDEDLEFGMRIASLGATGAGAASGRLAQLMARFGGSLGGLMGAGATPLAMYKVYPDGREELVRGAEFARIGLKAFKRIQAAGTEPYVQNTGGALAGSTIAAPSFVFEELDLAKIDRDFDKPPILPSPLARADAVKGVEH